VKYFIIPSGKSRSFGLKLDNIALAQFAIASESFDGSLESASAKTFFFPFSYLKSILYLLNSSIHRACLLLLGILFLNRPSSGL